MSAEDLAQRLWNNGGELKGPVVEAYYGWRGLAVPETQNLRFVASLPHKSGVSYPAIIGGKSAKAIAKVAPDLKQRGVRVRVAWPPEGVKDFNDMVMGAPDRAAASEAVRSAVENAEDWIDLPDDGGESEKSPTQAARLVQLAIANCDEFFHDENREAYAICHAPHDGGIHREVHGLKSKSFRESLLLVYFDTRRGVPNDSSIRFAIAVQGAIGPLPRQAARGVRPPGLP